MTLDTSFIKALETRFSGYSQLSHYWGKDQAYPQTLPEDSLVSSQAFLLEITEDRSHCSNWSSLKSVPSQSQGFLIHNPQEKWIYLLKVDAKWFEEKHSKRCDCLVFDSTSLCFVELKLNVDSWKRATERIKEASMQIQETLSFLKLNMLSCYLSRFSLEAYIVMQTSVYPRRTAERSARRLKFLEETGMKLYEENEKSF